jgi:hypothetical protein
MSNTAYALIVNREELPELISTGASGSLPVGNLFGQITSSIRQKQFMVGRWGSPSGDPFPDFIVVRDEEYSDTLAWLSAYLPGFAPISQWCRIWRLSEFARLENLHETPTLGSRFGAWIGAIIGEFGSQSQSNLKEISAAATLSGASYCAARATAVWGTFDRFEEIHKRSELLAGRQRENARGISAEQMLPLWYVLAGEHWGGKPPAEARSLQPLVDMVSSITGTTDRSQDEVVSHARILGQRLGLPEIGLCAIGPQSQRVEALDKLAERLLAGPRTPAINAMMGFGASLVDPGTPVLPELLKRYSQAAPAAAMWAGAFAGMWFPVRALSEHGGLGRLIGKSLLSQSDLFTKPSADVSFDELSRWTAGNFSVGVPLRGLFMRTWSVELIPGVVVPVPAARTDGGRVEVARADGANGSKQQALELSSPSQRPPDKSGGGATGHQSKDDLYSRVDKIERTLDQLIRKLAKRTLGTPTRGSKP